MQSDPRMDRHLFRTSQNNRAIVLQVDTGFFFEVDALCEAVLRWSDTPTNEAVPLDPTQGFDPRLVSQAIRVLTDAGLINARSIPPHSTSSHSRQSNPTRETSGGSDVFGITLHVAHACNLKCAYCFAHGGDYGGQPRLMRAEVARQAVRWVMQEAKSFQQCRIGFFGGEPLLNFELIREIIPFAREHASRLGIGVSFGIATNGTVMSPEMLEFLIHEEVQIQVSVDGNKTDHDRIRIHNDGSDTYDVVARNVMELTDRSPDSVSVRATMTSYNLDRQSIANAVDKFGACQVEIAPVVAAPHKPYALREEHLAAIKQELKELSRFETDRILKGSEERGFFDDYMDRLMTRAKACHGCQGGKTFLAVDVDGDIYFCSSLADRPEFKMGDVFSGLDLAVQDAFDKSYHVDARSDCRRCWAKNLCGGGCLYDARTATGDPIKPNPVSCEQIRYSYELAMEMCLEIQSADETALQERYNLRWDDAECESAEL